MKNMGGVITFYEKLLMEYELLNKKIKDLQNVLENMPKGELGCSKNGNSFKWFDYSGEERKYIYKKDRKLAEKLALKKYYSFQLEDALREQKAILSYLSKCPNPRKADKLLSDDSGFKELLKPYFTPMNEELDKWASASYETNKNHPENLKFKTSRGYYVRSKSESMIDKILLINKIPFRYECLLSLNGLNMYPDFTIRHPKTAEYYYWEHFGMMDNPTYASNAMSKLHTYVSNGIYPTINLIATYETKENPIDINDIEKIVEQYFL